MSRKVSNIIIGIVLLYILWRMYYWYFIKGFIVPVFYGIVFIATIVAAVYLYRKTNAAEAKRNAAEEKHDSAEAKHEHHSHSEHSAHHSEPSEKKED